MILIKKKHIIYNTILTDIMKKYVIAHELGHALLHKEICRYFIEYNTFFSPDKFEKAANIFAAELLISDKTITEMINEDTSIEKLAYELEIPKELIIIKLNSMNKDIFFNILPTKYIK